MEGHYTEKNISILYKPFDVDELLNLVAKKLESSEEAGERREPCEES